MTDPSRTSKAALPFQSEWCRFTLASIGEAVLATDIEAPVTFLSQVLGNSHPVKDFEVEHVFPALGPRTMLLNARRCTPDGDDPELDPFGHRGRY